MWFALFPLCCNRQVNPLSTATEFCTTVKTDTSTTTAQAGQLEYQPALQARTPSAGRGTKPASSLATATACLCRYGEFTMPISKQLRDGS